MIHSTFLHDVANYTNGRVAKVVLNGTFEITDFELKEVTGSVVTINYFVFAEELSQIDRIELRDATGNVISVNEVDIPIAADQLLIQSIEVKEVTN